MFDAGDRARLGAALQRLLPFVREADVALTGSVAIAHHVAAAGRDAVREHLTDVDFVAGDLDRLDPAMTRIFLVSHYHRQRTGVPKALVQLVDPDARLRIDIFPDVAHVRTRAGSAMVADTPLRVVRAEDILDHKRALLARASLRDPVDPKHRADAVALASLLGQPAPPPVRYVAEAIYATDVDAVCARCERSRDERFSLARKREIIAVLGYV